MIISDCRKLEAQRLEIFANSATKNSPHKVVTDVLTIVIVPQVLHFAILSMMLEAKEDLS